MKFVKPTNWTAEEWSAFEAKLIEVTKVQSEKKKNLRGAAYHIKRAMPSQGEDKSISHIMDLIQAEIAKIEGVNQNKKPKAEKPEKTEPTQEPVPVPEPVKVEEVKPAKKNGKK